MKGVNPYIKQFKNDLTKGKQCVKIFFPMCGDVADMSWMADMGIYCHTKSFYVIY
jgi:hypothetical protein